MLPEPYPPRVATPQRHVWLVAGAAAGGLVMLRFFEQQLVPFLPVCPLHAVTGLYCPGCGATRATRALLHGDLAAAWNFNPLVVASLPLLALLLLSARYSTRPLGASPWLAWSVLTIIVLFGIARNIPIAPFTALAPH